ncbi:helix-turn-helix domain-containing protein [Streptomyces puniciscabiei]
MSAVSQDQQLRARAVLCVLSGRESVERAAECLRIPQELVIDWCQAFVEAGLRGLRGPHHAAVPARPWEQQLRREIRELQQALAEASTELALWEALRTLDDGHGG